MAPRTDQFETRHIMLSKSRGAITELENIGNASGSENMYVIRYHKGPHDAGRIFEAGSWIGFRYHDANWSFVKQAD